MWLFTKKIPDNEWLTQVHPLYEDARVASETLTEALREGTPESRRAAVHEAALSFPVLLDGIQGVPAPTSPGARRAWKDVCRGCNDLVEASYWGDSVLNARTRNSPNGYPAAHPDESGDGLPWTRARSPWERLIDRGVARLSNASSFFVESERTAAAN